MTRIRPVVGFQNRTLAAFALIVFVTGCGTVTPVDAPAADPIANARSPDGLVIALERVLVPNPDAMRIKLFDDDAYFLAEYRDMPWDVYVLTFRNTGAKPMVLRMAELESPLVPVGRHSHQFFLLLEATKENFRALERSGAARRVDMNGLRRTLCPTEDNCYAPVETQSLPNRVFERLPFFPVRLPAGASVTLRHFFPVTPAPSALRVVYATDGAARDFRLKLDRLGGLHMLPGAR